MRESEMYVNKVPGIRSPHVGEKLDEIYREHGYAYLAAEDDSESNKRCVIETESFERASRKLDTHDRRSIEMMTDSLSKYCGKTFGVKSAHQVLAKIGILLNSVESF